MSNQNSIRVFIAEDHAIVRKGVRTLLSLEKDIEVIGEATNGREAVEQVNHLNPDVILMDLVMPELDGIQAIQQIKVNNPNAKVLVNCNLDLSRNRRPRRGNDIRPKLVTDDFSIPLQDYRIDHLLAFRLPGLSITN